MLKRMNKDAIIPIYENIMHIKECQKEIKEI
jgi:hypothetical protein